MTKAVSEGLPKRLIEEAAIRRQAAVDRGEEVIVGVNKCRLEDAAHLDILEIDNSAVRAAQIRRLEDIRSRDGVAIESALETLETVAKTGDGNLLEAAVAAARARATVGEISDARRRAFGDHEAFPEVVGNIYGPAYGDDPEIQDACRTH
ncbi:methylmalonyl-CoA mutase N-terminal domain/subunit [Phyllobacterium ifriqiyense]